MAVTTADLVNEFIALDAKRKALEGDVDKLKEQLAVLEPQIMQRFENAGMQSMKSTSGVTLYINRQLWASPRNGDHATLVAALREIGLTDMIKTQCNTQTLSAYIREQEKDLFTGKASPDELIAKLPPVLQSCVEISEKFGLRAKRS